MLIDGSATSRIFSFPALTDGILDMVGTKSFLVSLLGGNAGFELSGKEDLVFFIKGSVMQRIGIKILKLGSFCMG